MPDNDWDDDSSDQNDQSTNFQQLRAHARELEKARKAQEKELESLRQYKAESEAKLKAEQVKALIAEMGLPPKVAGLYKGDAEPTAVAEWVKEYGDVFGVQRTPEVEESGSFSPMDIGVPPSTRYTYEQYRKLLNSDPQRAAQAVQEGRVDGMYNQPSNPIQ